MRIIIAGVIMYIGGSIINWAVKVSLPLAAPRSKLTHGPQTIRNGVEKNSKTPIDASIAGSLARTRARTDAGALG